MVEAVLGLRGNRGDQNMREYHRAGSAALFGALCLALPAHAAVTISSAATSNMTCASGICAPTATDAVLNVGDLEAMLSSGSAEVTTTGSGSVQADNIEV